MTSNYNKHIFLSFSAFVLILMLVACGNRRQETSGPKPRKKSDKELEMAMAKQDSVPFDFFTVRIGVDFNSKAQNVGFSCYLKLNVDTAFSGTIKSGPVVVSTFMVTRDSVFVANKQPNKCYIKQDLAYLSILFGTEVEFDFFQDLILGLPLGYDPENKYQQIPDKDHYVMSTHKKRDFRKLENDPFALDEDILIKYHLDPETLEVFKVDLDVPADTTTIAVNYLEHKLEDGFKVPEETTIEILNPKDSIFIRLNYGSVKLNEPREIKINIPDSYSECK